MSFVSDGYSRDPGGGGSPGAVAIDDITDWPAGVGATEVGYLNGAASNIQNQLDGKAPNSHNHPASAINSGVFDKARLDLTSNGDLLTVIGGVLARLGLGSALHVLRVNAAGNGLEYAAPSGFTPQVAIFRRTGTNQTGISGSYALDGLEYNSEVLDTGNNWTISGDEHTCTNGGLFVFIQHNRGATGLNSFDIEIAGTLQKQDHYLGVARPVHVYYANITAGQKVRFTCQSSSAYTLEHDGSGAGVNQVIAIRLAAA